MRVWVVLVLVGVLTAAGILAGHGLASAGRESLERENAELSKTLETQRDQIADLVWWVDHVSPRHGVRCEFPASSAGFDVKRIWGRVEQVNAAEGTLVVELAWANSVWPEDPGVIWRDPAPFVLIRVVEVQEERAICQFKAPDDRGVRVGDKVSFLDARFRK